MEIFLKASIKQFEYYKSVGEKTFAQLEETQLFVKPNEESNSIAIIVGHMAGNMLSRWTDFLTSDGEKEWRNRDLEFEENINTKAELLNKWNEGWNCLFEALALINSDNFNTIIYIRNEPHSITDAIQRQIAHYAYHVGQIVFLGKLLVDTNWKSLTIPKGKSSDFNAEKMSK